MNIADAIQVHAARQPDAIAVVSNSGDMTWAALDRGVQGLATTLGGSGVGAGTVVALSIRDETLALASMLALARLGASSVSLPIHETLPIKTRIAEHTGATVLVRDTEDGAVAGLFASDLLVSTGELRAYAMTEAPVGPSQAHPQAPCFLVVGSGTTGDPKIMPISHEIFKLRSDLWAERLTMNSQDRLAAVSKVDYWVSKQAYLTALCHGVPIVILDRQGDLVEQCRRLGVSILFLTSVHLDQLLKQLTRKHERPLDFLRVLRAGGAMVSESLRRRTLKHLAGCLHVSYAMNDFGLATVAGPDDILAVPGTVGYPVEGVEIEIRDQQGQVLPAGSTGEIWLRSKAMIPAYHNDPAATARHLINGWFKPGDLGSLDPSGQLLHYGRSDHMMVVNGVNISPAEIENCLSAHPAVADSSAFPLQHAVHQHIPVCAVELHEGAAATEEDLSAFALAHIGSRSPSRIIILSKLPRNELGKIRRVELVKQVAARLGIPLQN